MRISDWSSDVCSSDLAEKCGLHDPERAVTLLGNDDLRLALVRRLFAIELRIVVDLVAVDHQHEIGVLFDTAGLTQIRHLGRLLSRCSTTRLSCDSAITGTSSYLARDRKSDV